jgi:amino acid permease
MSRIVSTAIVFVAILMLLYMRGEAIRLGFPAIFSMVPLAMIVILVFGLIRSWIRR